MIFFQPRFMPEERNGHKYGLRSGYWVRGSC